VAMKILSQPDLVSSTLSLMINIAYECRKMRNFFGAFAVVNGVGMTPVSRLDEQFKN